MHRNLENWVPVVSILDRLNTHYTRRMAHIHLGDKLLSMQSPGQLASIILTTCEEIDSEIDASLDGWSLGERLPRCGDLAAAWRGQRIRAAHSFLLFLDVEKQPGALFVRKAGTTVEEAVKWLLTDWWYDRGVVWHATWLKATATFHE